MAESPQVELIDVTKLFGDTTAVDRVSLTVGSSEFLTLLGPSGCGKTTLLRMIGGFITPDSGHVLLGGVDVTGRPPYRRNVCTVFQQYALLPHMTVSQNVAFGLQQRRVGRASREQIDSQVKLALEMVRLAGVDSRYPQELSGGQQQRVALARALVLQPKVLLLDEPLAALDLKLRKQMQLELKGLQRALALSFIYVTHDQEEALTMSDRIAVMNAGRIEQVGLAADVYDRPRTEFVADFIGLSNILEGVIVASNGRSILVDLGGCKVEVHGPEGDGASAVGSTRRFMIRPEKVMLSAPPDGAGIPGVIESTAYLGDTTRWHIKLDGGQQIQAAEQNSGVASRPKLKVGERVAVGWPPGSAIIL